MRRRRRIVSSPRSTSLFIATSNLHLRAELDHLVRRQTEGLRGTARIAHHPSEQALAPDGHAGSAGGDEGLPAEEVTGAHRVESDRPFDCGQQRRNVWIFAEAEAHN